MADPLAKQRAYDRLIDTAHGLTGVDGDYLRQLDPDSVNRLINQSILSKAASNARDQDLAKGRARADEIFGPDAPGSGLQDVLARRKAALGGLNSEANNALRSEYLNSINSNTLAASRSLRAAQGANGVRGPAAAAQHAQLAKTAMQQKADAGRDLLIKNIDAKNKALDSYESTVGRRDFGKIGTEIGYGSMGSAERGAIAQELIGKEQAAAQIAAANRGGKK